MYDNTCVLTTVTAVTSILAGIKWPDIRSRLGMPTLSVRSIWSQQTYIQSLEREWGGQALRLSGPSCPLQGESVT